MTKVRITMMAKVRTHAFGLALLITNFMILNDWTLAGELDHIKQMRSGVWCEACPGGRITVDVAFKLDVGTTDKALGFDYFPNSDLTGRVVNILYWEERTSRAGSKYRSAILDQPPDSFKGSLPATYKATRFFNGKNSWNYQPLSEKAEQQDKVTVITQLYQDYYGDFVGSLMPRGPHKFLHFVNADINEPYDLNGVLGSGSYHLAGDDLIGGESCTVIERQGLDRIWLAKAKNFVVVKREWNWTQNGPLKRRIYNQDFREVGTGVWLPFKGIMEIFGHPSSRPGIHVGTLSATVRKAESDIPDSVFEPDFPKGTRVTNLATGTTTKFGLSESELENEAKAKLSSATDESARKMLEFRPDPIWIRYKFTLIMILSVCVVVVVVVVAIGRRLR